MPHIGLILFVAAVAVAAAQDIARGKFLTTTDGVQRVDTGQATS
jgi:hypothetical protein